MTDRTGQGAGITIARPAPKRRSQARPEAAPRQHVAEEVHAQHHLLSVGPPHDPYGLAPEKYRALYDGKPIQLRPNVPADHAAEALTNLRGYYAHIAALDGCVRKLKRAVDESGQAEDTIFIFASDHGDMLQGQGTHHKQQPWDESLRVPFLVRYPRLLGRKSRTLDTPINAPDIMPTLLGLAGLKRPNRSRAATFRRSSEEKKRMKPSPPRC